MGFPLTGVGGHSLLQGICQTQGLKTCIVCIAGGLFNTIPLDMYVGCILCKDVFVVYARINIYTQVYIYTHVCMLLCHHSVMPDSETPMDCSPTRLLRPWDSPGKSTGVGCHALLQGDLPDAGITPESLALGGGFFTPEPAGKPYLYILFCILFHSGFITGYWIHVPRAPQQDLVVDPFSEQEFASASSRLPFCISHAPTPLTTTNVFSRSLSLFPRNFVIFFFKHPSAGPVIPSAFVSLSH